MPYGLQSSFSSGELAPTLWGRVDFAKYQTGLKKLENFVVRPHGGVTKRCGTTFVTRSHATSDKTCRLVPFVYNDSTSCVLEFTEYSIRVFDVDANGNLELVMPNSKFITNYPGLLNTSKDGYKTPYLADEIATLAFAQSANTFYIVHRNHPPMSFFRNSLASLEGYNENSDWRLEEIVITGGPFIKQSDREYKIRVKPSAVDNPSSGSAYIEVVGLVNGDGTTPASQVNDASALKMFSSADVGRRIKLVQQNEETEYKIDNGMFGRVEKNVYVMSYSNEYRRRTIVGNGGYYATEWTEYGGEDAGSGYYSTYWVPVTETAFWITNDNYDYMEPKTGDFLQTSSAASGKEESDNQQYYVITRIAKNTSKIYFCDKNNKRKDETTTSGYLLYVNSSTESKEAFESFYSSHESEWAGATTADDCHVRMLTQDTIDGQYPEESKGTITTEKIKEDLEKYTNNTNSSIKFWGIGINEEVWVYDSWSLLTNGFWGGTFHLQKFDEDSGTWLTLKTYTSPLPDNKEDASGATSKNYSDSGTFDEPAKIRIISYDFTPYVPRSNKNEDAGVIYFHVESSAHTGIAKITSVVSSTRANVYIETRFCNTNATNLWQKSAWTLALDETKKEKIGYPGAICFYQDRLIFASSYAQPQTVWMSKTSDYYDFSESIPVEDDDAINITLNSRQVNPIRYFAPVQALVAMTSGSEWVIGNSSNVLTPSDITAKPQGYRGTAELEPIIIGTMILFVQQHGKHIRDLGYSYENGGYIGNDLTVMADHIFRGHNILDWCYQQEPNSVLWLVRDDGLLCSLTYLKEHDVFAWARHPTEGKVVSVACISNDVDSGDDLVLCVNRNGKMCIEVMKDQDHITTPEEAHFVDSGLTLDNTAYSGSISNLAADYSRDWFYFNKDRVLTADYTMKHLSTSSTYDLVTDTTTYYTQGILDGEYPAVKFEVIDNKIVTTSQPTKVHNSDDFEETENAVDEGVTNWSGFNGLDIPVLSDGIFYADFTISKGTAVMSNIRIGYSAYALSTRITDTTNIPEGTYMTSICSSDVGSGNTAVTHAIIKNGVKCGTYEKVPFSVSSGKIMVRPTTTMKSFRLTSLNGMTLSGNIPDGEYEGTFTVSSTGLYNGDALYAVTPVSITISVTGFMTISGLDHLEGLTVTTLINGSYGGLYTVKNGKITLTEVGQNVHVGLPYDAKLNTLDMVTNKQDGTTMTRKSRVVSVGVRVEKTRGLVMGTDEDHLDQSVDRIAEDYGDPTRLITDDIRISIDSTYESKASGSIWVESKVPLPASILAIIPEVSFGG